MSTNENTEHGQQGRDAEPAQRSGEGCWSRVRHPRGQPLGHTSQMDTAGLQKVTSNTEEANYIKINSIPTNEITAHSQQDSEARQKLRSGASSRSMERHTCRGNNSKRRHRSKGTPQQQTRLSNGGTQHMRTHDTLQGHRAPAAGETRPRSDTLKEWMRNGGEGQSLMAVD